MEIVKKNILSIICGVVALIAVVASFWPLGGYREQLSSNLQSRAAVYTSVTSLKNKNRVKPVVNMTGGEPEQLNRFPNKEIIEQGETIKTQIEAEGKKVLDMA